MTRGLARIVLMVGVVACGRSTAYRAPSPAPLVADHAPAVALACRVDAGGWAEQRERGDLHGLRRLVVVPAR